ncbi:hypothetical protein F2P56_011100 [Juglans regia]|uniref:RING-type E3 ubiquitin transferase n=2 Tax=Juglans regia TaxID=51240 RepID=A0A833XTB0_JUGRE|nr:E3 ubiquitin-protein ligase RING1-like [Juglans regia]KAF5470596.1 hypothetical protein F2P56_011100 [Juglans regia]
MYRVLHSIGQAPAPAPASEPGIPTKNAWEIPLIATVCSVIILFSYYRILKPLYCTNYGVISRNRVGRQILNEANPDDPSLQFHSHALESSILNSLPISQFEKSKEGEETQITTDCAVCLGEFEEGQWLKRLPICTHAFHVSCIDTWFQTHSNCPLCRSHVHDLALHHEFESPVSQHTVPQILRREDFFHERAEHYQILRSTILTTS